MCGCKSHMVLSKYTSNKILLFTFNEKNMNLSFYLAKNIMGVITFFNNNCFIFSIEHKAIRYYFTLKCINVKSLHLISNCIMV